MKQNNIAGIIMLFIGLMLNIFPSKIWQITEKWKFNISEPPKKYNLCLKIVGVLFIVVGILLLFGIIK